MKSIYFTLVAAVTLTGCSHFFNGDQKHAHLPDMNLKSISSKVMSKSGSKVVGDLRFTQKAEGVELTVDMKGVDPNTVHGFHIHENGDCSAKDAKSAGGHFNPTGHQHGSPKDVKHHLGDLGNVKADKNGMIKGKIIIDGATIEEKGTYSILNRSVILHAKADDLKSQPSGAAGARIACAVISNK